MCGITSVFALNGRIREEALQSISAATAMLHHRGPDECSIVYDSRFALGNTRLRILDLSDRGRMPMSSDDGSVWISYNGESTNFKSLIERYELRAKGPFQSDTDTEVLLRLYGRLGIDFVKELTGQFAFSLVDTVHQKAFVVRDFFGQRPLYYTEINGYLYVASEIPALLEVRGVSRELDRQGLYDYLTLGYYAGERTPFEAIHELGGGEMLVIDLEEGQWSRSRYYDLKFEPNLRRSEAVTKLEVAEKLRASVARNMISDAPLGITVSGGIDATSILSMASKMPRARDLHTFSIQIKEPSFDESTFQRDSLVGVRSTHHVIAIRPEDVMDALDATIAVVAEPSVNGANVPSYLLAQKASEHVRVLLSGEGGDEIFNAYPTHLAFLVRQMYLASIPERSRHMLRSLVDRLPVAHRKLSLDFRLKRFVHGAEATAATAHAYWRHVLDHDTKKALVGRWSGSLAPAEEYFETIYNACSDDEPLSRISRIDLNHFLIDDLMVKNDRTFMAHSVEARFPFLDRELVEYVATIPARLRMKHLQPRYIQKKAMRSYLPPSIYRRSGMGLEMPHSIWFFDALQPLLQQELSPERIEALGLFDVKVVQQLVKEHLSGKVDHGRALWALISFSKWHRLYVQSNDYRQHFRRPSKEIKVIRING